MITIKSTAPAQMVICGATKNFAVSIYNPSPFLLTSDTLILSMRSGYRSILKKLHLSKN